MIRLIIDGRLPGLNDYTLANRTNRFAGAKMKKEQEEKIGACIRSQLQNVHFDGAVALDFYWYEPNKRRDIDNIAFAKKFILDSLVRNEIIESDSWSGVVSFSDNFAIDKRKPRIEVFIRKV